MLAVSSSSLAGTLAAGDGADAGAAAEEPAAAEEGALPEGWQAIWDEDSGQNYYYHEASGETSWDPPA